MDTSKVSRIEVIGHTNPNPSEGDFERGRVYVKWPEKDEPNIRVEIQLQDDNRTLKIFIREML